MQVGVDLDRARVQAGLVGEGADPDVRLARGGRHVGHLRDPVRHPGGLAQAAAGQERDGRLELEVGDDGDQVGVTGALAVPVGGPCTCEAPASTAARELATAQPVPLWEWMPTRAPVA